MAGFRRFYNLNWRKQCKKTFWIDLMVLVEKLDEYQWSKTDENIAHLVDREDYWLTAEYSSWITDPDDPEVQRTRDERKRLGEKPPPLPVLWPVAERPLHAAIRRHEAVMSQLKHVTQPQKKKTTISQFRQALGR